jgi:hypothetical protein
MTKMLPVSQIEEGIFENGIAPRGQFLVITVEKYGMFKGVSIASCVEGANACAKAQAQPGPGEAQIWRAA